MRKLLPVRVDAIAIWDILENDTIRERYGKFAKGVDLSEYQRSEERKET